MSGGMWCLRYWSAWMCNWMWMGGELIIQVYVRLGIRVLYKGWKSQMAGGRGE